MPNVYTLSSDDFTHLAPDRAVEFLRRLLWAESTRVGVGRHLIHVPQNINEGDGGIDAIIQDATPTEDDLIPTGTSGFQSKAGDLSPAKCKRELHEGSFLSNPIRPEIKRLLDADGTYVLVLFTNLTASKKRAREDAIKEELVEAGYPNPKVRLLEATQLAGFAERFPALVARLRSDASHCLPYAIWAGNRDVSDPKTFLADDERAEWIETFRDALRNRKNTCPVFRVSGLSGIGKTRVVFEALGADDLRDQVIYVKADAFNYSPLFRDLVLDNSLTAIVVVDECDIGEHDQFVRELASRGAQLALLTLSHDVGKVPYPAVRYLVEKLDDEKIKGIIATEFPSLPKEVVERLSRFADGFPRIAVLLAQSYIRSSGTPDQFLLISDDALMNRLVGGGADFTSEYFRKTRRVLTGISLFSKVGYKGDLVAEAKWLASAMNVPWQDFVETIGEQRQRGIIQGQSYVYVTPFMLRIHLLSQWWETQGLTNERFQEFIASIPAAFRADMFRRFIDHLPYITATARGRSFAASALGISGIYAQEDLLKTDPGGKLFLALTEADPESALALLRRTVGTWSKEELLNFSTGRREVIWALERIAMWRPLFADAARILLALAEAENERWSNNASGVFAGLFSPGVGQIAPTEAPPEARLPVLKEALASQSRERRILAIKACEVGLQSYSISRVIGTESQGLRREPQLWMPKTYGEWFDKYRLIWNLLASSLDNLPSDERLEAVKVLLHQARGLVQIANLTDMVLDTIESLSMKPYVNAKDILATVIEILHYDGKHLPQATRARLERIRNVLTGSGFSALMRRYVGMDLLQDRFDEKGNQVDQTQPKIEELAEQAAQDPGLLRPELGWLVTREAPNGYRFGYELGKRDASFLLLAVLLDAQKAAGESRSLDFLGGYFRALAERVPELWESKLDELVTDSVSGAWVPELTWRSRLPSDKAADRILRLASQGLVPVEMFRLFVLGGVIHNISADVFDQWLDFLLREGSGVAVAIALELFFMRFRQREGGGPLPGELTRRLLLHDTWYRPEPNMYRQTEEHMWADVAKAFIRDHPEDSIALASKLLQHLGEDNTIAGGFHTQVHSVPTEIMRKYPGRVWDIAARYLGPPIDSRAFHIKDWLRGGDLFGRGEHSALSLVPPEKLWEWVDQDPDKRAWYLASFVPNVLFRSETEVCLAREVLVRYGDREDVRRNLMSNFSTEGWAGPASAHFQQKQETLLEFKKDETNSKVLRWIDEYVSSLERQIKRELVEEEREEL